MQQPPPGIDTVIDQIGPRLRRARERNGVTLASLARSTGISTSTLSRLESGQRKPSLELLLPVTTALEVPLDEIVATPRVIDPRVPRRPTSRNGRVIVPLSRSQAEPRAYKMTVPADDDQPQLRTHTGYEWLYVLRGRLRVRLDEHDFVMGPGEAAEFDCRIPHWFGSTGRGSVETLSLFGSQGERVHLRAKPRRRVNSDKSR